MTQTHAEWVTNWLTKEKIIKPDTISPLGIQVACILNELYKGIYHLDTKELKRIEWSNDFFIEWLTQNNFATFDGHLLTYLVILAHDYCTRVQIGAANSRHLRIIFHPRKRDAATNSTRHPKLEEHIAQFRFYAPTRGLNG